KNVPGRRHEIEQGNGLALNNFTWRLRPVVIDFWAPDAWKSVGEMSGRANLAGTPGGVATDPVDIGSARSQTLKGGTKDLWSFPTLHPANNKPAAARLRYRLCGELNPCGPNHRDLAAGLRAPKGCVGSAIRLNRLSSCKRSTLDKSDKKALRFLT